MRLIFDLESNGLYEEATVVHCIVTKDIDTGDIHKYTNGVLCNTAIDTGIKVIEQADELIGHNIIDYDLRLLKKLYPTFEPKGLIFDTMIVSQLLQPDRAGGHSLQAAGERQGRSKPEHEDWSQFSPEMLHRCTEDVEINHVLYNELIEEAYEPIQGIEFSKIFL